MEGCESVAAVQAFANRCLDTFGYRGFHPVPSGLCLPDNQRKHLCHFHLTEEVAAFCIPCGRISMEGFPTVWIWAAPEWPGYWIKGKVLHFADQWPANHRDATLPEAAGVLVRYPELGSVAFLDRSFARVPYAVYWRSWPELRDMGVQQIGFRTTKDPNQWCHHRLVVDDSPGVPWRVPDPPRHILCDPKRHAPSDNLCN